MTEPALVVEVHRSGRIESRHRVRLVACDPDGATIAATGDVTEPIYPRSAIKPFQAVPLVESGAADAFRLDTEELALVCASHSGTPTHVAVVARLLARLGLGPDDLGCGPHPPLDDAAACALCRAGEPPGRLHNNCSGKHAGMLALARHLGAATAGYLDPGHPVQRAILAAVGAFCATGVDAPGGDGCGAPAPAMPLVALARGAAQLADPTSLPALRRRAVERIGDAMRRHPDLVSGPGRTDLALMRATPGVLTKTGAEGVFIAAVPARRVGLALKVEDGAGRAAAVALAAALDALRPQIADPAAWAEQLRAPVLDTNRRQVGAIVLGAGSRTWLEATLGRVE